MHHLKKLLDLVWLRLPLARLQAERARDLRMCVDMVTAADAAQCEAERLDKTAKLDEADVPHITRHEVVPQFRSA
jgi:hypothetical protein